MGQGDVVGLFSQLDIGVSVAHKLSCVLEQSYYKDTAPVISTWYHSMMLDRPWGAPPSPKPTASVSMQIPDREQKSRLNYYRSLSRSPPPRSPGSPVLGDLDEVSEEPSGRPLCDKLSIGENQGIMILRHSFGRLRLAVMRPMVLIWYHKMFLDQLESPAVVVPAVNALDRRFQIRDALEDEIVEESPVEQNKASRIFAFLQEAFG